MPFALPSPKATPVLCTRVMFIVPSRKEMGSSSLSLFRASTVFGFRSWNCAMSAAGMCPFVAKSSVPSALTWWKPGKSGR